MTLSLRERIFEFIARFPGRDDDEIAEALSIQPRQTVNQACRSLAQAGRLLRKPGPKGKIANYPARAFSASSSTDDKAVEMDASNANFDWYWEGNVCSALATFLRENGWVITAVADTLSKQRGPDIVAVREHQKLIMEVKGFPPSTYRDTRRAAEQKRTAPTIQAQHWYAQAILKALRLQHEHPEALVGIALPDFPRYRNLFSETRDAFVKLDLLVCFVGETSTVEIAGPGSTRVLQRKV